MTAFSENYLAFRNDVIGFTITQRELEKLISEFQAEINSKRRSSYINSSQELINVLEKRGYLESNFEDFLRRSGTTVPAIGRMMTRYQPGQRLFSNHFESSGLPTYTSGIPTYGYRRQPSYSSVRTGASDTETIREVYNILPRAVIDRIVRDIGTNWKELARELSIREGDIDDIESKYPRNLKEKARECLKLFIDDADPCKVQPILLEALNKCGRRDLRESVQEILSRRY